MTASTHAVAARAAAACVLLVPLASLAARAGQAETVEQVAAELANPLAPVTSLAADVRAELGNGPQDETHYQLRLKPSFFVPFADKSALLVRTIVARRSVTSPVSASGLGDVSLVPYYVRVITSATFVGFGGALILPTAADDALGSGKCAAGPAAIVAQTGKPVTWGDCCSTCGHLPGTSIAPA